MITFDYSLRKNQLKNLEVGDYFMSNDTLYVKIPTVIQYSILNPDPKDKPKYNAYDFEYGRLVNIDEYQEVVKCNVDITAKPLR